MRILAPGGRSIRYGVGFTAPSYVVREDGDETTATGVAMNDNPFLRSYRDPGLREREEPRCRR